MSTEAKKLLDMEPLYTPREVADLFRVEVQTVTKWARDGRLAYIRLPNGTRRYTPASVRALLLFTMNP